MSDIDPVTSNPNDKQSPGKPLGHNEVAPTEDNGLGPVNEDEDEPGLPKGDGAAIVGVP